jgi:hypothetical protein
MTLEVVVQAHPRRSHLAEKLAADLSGSVVYDPEPDGYPSPWRCYRACLEREPSTTHRLVIQEDAIVCANFLPAVERIIEARPVDPVVLFASPQAFLGVISMERACRADETFALWPAGFWVPAVAVIWPVERIPVVLAYVDKKKWPETFRADDEIIGRATSDNKIPVWATVPSLVEHPDQAPSVVAKNRARQGKNRDRLAWCLIDGDPLSVDWR